MRAHPSAIWRPHLEGNEEAAMQTDPPASWRRWREHESQLDCTSGTCS